MSTQGPLSPATTANVDRSGNPAWSNTGNVVSSNNSYATVNLTAFQTSDWLTASNFGFSIPTAATITGINVEIESKSTQDFDLIDFAVFKTAVGTDVTATIEYPLFTGESYASSGDYLWGTTWTPAEVNASTFGVAVYVGEGSGGTPTCSIDHIRVTVTYELPAPLGGNNSMQAILAM